MAHNILYNIYRSTKPTFSGALAELVAAAKSTELVPLRLVFYGKPHSNKEYGEQREEIIKNCTGKFTPLISYVAQHPTQLTLALEVQMVGRDFAKTLQYKELGGVRYVVSNSSSSKQLFTEGIVADFLSDSIRKQSVDVLAKLEAILEQEKMPIDSIIRQWNYIEQITAMSGETQHYQDFNDARSHFYAKTEWRGGYPAATGIGTDVGGVMVEIDAEVLKKSPAKIVPIDNPLQVAAHKYSQGVLIGAPDEVFKQRTTPKFERAKAVAIYDCAKVYISGTAAIRGEESLTGVGIERQTVITLENIEYLISKKNLANHGITVRNEPQIQVFRVYLKCDGDMEAARRIIEERYPHLPAIYVVTDVCRDELLIEIEGVAQC